MKANGKVIASDLAKKYQVTLNRVKIRLLELNRTGFLIDGKLRSFTTSAGSMDYEFTFTRVQFPAYYHAEPTNSTPSLASQRENIESPSDTRPGQVTFSPESTEISIPPWRDMAITGLVMTIIALFVCALMFIIAFSTNAIIGLSMTAAQTVCIIVGLILVVKLKKLGGIILLANSILMFIPGDPFSMMVVPMLGLFATPSAIAGILFIKALDIKTKALKKQEMNAGEIEKRHSDHFSGWVLSVIAICACTCLMANFILYWNYSSIHLGSLSVVTEILGIGYLPILIASMLAGAFVTQKRKTSIAGGVVMLFAGISAWVVVFIAGIGSSYVFYDVGTGILVASIPAIISGIIIINQRFRPLKNQALRKVTCPSCGAEIEMREIQYVFCPDCGAKLDQ